MAKVKTKGTREEQIPVRATELEKRYLELGAASEPTGKQAVSTWLRGLGMARTAERTGKTFAEFEREEVGARTEPGDEQAKGRKRGSK